MPDSKTNKERYRALCDNQPSIPLFMQAWWMDAVCSPNDKNWDVFIVENDGKIVGAMPFHLLKKFGFKIIVQPPLTQYNGIWIDYPENQTINQKLRFEKMIMTDIIGQINREGISLFQQNFHYSITNWQPFYWQNFKQSTRYTYVLKDISNTENIFNNIHAFKKKHIKKAQRSLHVDFEIKADEFYDFHATTLKLNEKSIFYSWDLFKSIYSYATERNQGAIIGIRDKEKNIHSAAFVVWDSNSAYYLISAIHPNYKSSGASNLMVWEAILFLGGKTKDFDFEGSMIEGVAKAFEEFGAEQIAYFNIAKFNYIFSLYMNLSSYLDF